MEHLDKFTINFWASVTKGSTPGDCWNWKGAKDADGYSKVSIWMNRKGICRGAHRVSYAIHNGRFNESLFVLHKCDNPTCTNPLHLFLGTHQDNMDDRTSKNRTNPRKGTDVSTSKLTEADVIYIYTHQIRGNSVLLAKRFNVHHPTISKIWNKKLWKQLTDQFDSIKEN